MRSRPGATGSAASRPPLRSRIRIAVRGPRLARHAVVRTRARAANSTASPRPTRLRMTTQRAAAGPSPFRGYSRAGRRVRLRPMSGRHEREPDTAFPNRSPPICIEPRSSDFRAGSLGCSSTNRSNSSVWAKPHGRSPSSTSSHGGGLSRPRYARWLALRTYGRSGDDVRAHWILPPVLASLDDHRLRRLRCGRRGAGGLT